MKIQKTNTSHRYIFTSLTRNANLVLGFNPRHLPISKWDNGDYVVSKVSKINGSSVRAELISGRMMQLMEGDLIVGALGVRHATLEVTGTWREVQPDGYMHMLTGAGLMGKMTSHSAFITPLIEVEYVGHVFTGEHKSRMTDYAIDPPYVPFNVPVVLFVGTSMSSGKTTSARIVARQLKELGLNVSCAKLTGAGRYRDILSVKDAGADHILDFVDAGMPSSIVPPEEYQSALKKMLSGIAAYNPDVAIIEIGASPLEPYNGDIAIRAVSDQVKCTILCASDPYAVLGVMHSFDIIPTIVSGPAVNTHAGGDLIKKLCGVDALNLIDHQSRPILKEILIDKLGLD